MTSIILVALSFIAEVLYTHYCFSLTKEILIPVCCCCYPDRTLGKQLDILAQHLTKPFEKWIDWVITKP
jgi:hypothetical protein